MVRNYTEEKSLDAADVDCFAEDPSERKKSASGAVVAITIPSIEYPDQYKTYLPLWRQEFKEEGLVHCPNYKVCACVNVYNVHTLYRIHQSCCF